MAAPLVDLALTHLAAKVEALTRYDRSSLRVESGQARLTAGQASWLFTITLSNESTRHKGRLPYHAKRLESEVSLDETARHALEAGYTALPQRLQAWLARYEQTDRALEPSDCFDGPLVFGYERICSRCDRGWVPCGPCGGKGSLPCQRCEKTGDIPCPTCRGWIVRPLLGFKGAGRVTCRGCRGEKKINGVMCGTCNGKGTVQCSKCRGAGTLQCPDCGGKGHKVCAQCSGDGKLPCQECDHTGFLHTLCTVTCAVAPRFSVQMADPNPEVVSEFGNRNDLPRLRELSRVTRRPAIATNRTVERVYDFECAITELVVRVADKTVRLVGYSDKAWILNYKDIVTHLLAADLAALKQTVARVPWRFRSTPAELITVTQQFLASEVNVQIDDPAHVRDRIIDTAYKSAAKGLLRAALGRIFCAGMGTALLVTACAPSVVFLVGHVADVWPSVGGWAAVPLAVAAGLPLIVCERRARARLNATFDRSGGNKRPGLGRKVDGLLHQYHVLWKFRLFAWLVAAVVLAATAYTTTLSFPTLSMPGGRREKQNEPALTLSSPIARTTPETTGRSSRGASESVLQNQYRATPELVPAQPEPVLPPAVTPSTPESGTPLEQEQQHARQSLAALRARYGMPTDPSVLSVTEGDKLPSQSSTKPEPVPPPAITPSTSESSTAYNEARQAIDKLRERQSRRETAQQQGVQPKPPPPVAASEPASPPDQSATKALLCLAPWVQRIDWTSATARQSWSYSKRVESEITTHMQALSEQQTGDTTLTVEVIHRNESRNREEPFLVKATRSQKCAGDYGRYDVAWDGELAITKRTTSRRAALPVKRAK